MSDALSQAPPLPSSEDHSNDEEENPHGDPRSSRWSRSPSPVRSHERMRQRPSSVGIYPRPVGAAEIRAGERKEKRREAVSFRQPESFRYGREGYSDNFYDRKGDEPFRSNPLSTYAALPERPPQPQPRYQQSYLDAWYADPNITGDRRGELVHGGRTDEAPKRPSYWDCQSHFNASLTRESDAYRRDYQSALPSEYAAYGRRSPPPRRYYGRHNAPPLSGQPPSPYYGAPSVLPPHSALSPDDQAIYTRKYRPYQRDYQSYPPNHPAHTSRNPDHATRYPLDASTNPYALPDSQFPLDSTVHGQPDASFPRDPYTRPVLGFHREYPNNFSITTEPHSLDTSETDETSSADGEKTSPNSSGRLSLAEAEIDQLLTHEGLQAPKLSKDIGLDEDILSPSTWNSKVSSIESFVDSSHVNRRAWPFVWHQSINKTCPKALQGSPWVDICDVDRMISKIGLDPATASIDLVEQYQQRMGTLAQVYAAFKSQAAAKYPTPSEKETKSFHTMDEACKDNKGTVKEIVRILQARDYLILVCRDGEYLQEIHSSMDAITWFEELTSDDGTASAPMIELRSVNFSQLATFICSLNMILKTALWSWSNNNNVFLCDHTTTLLHVGGSNRTGLQPGFSQRTIQLIDSVTGSLTTRVQTLTEQLIGFGVGLADLNNEIEDLSALLSSALALQCNVHIVQGGDTRHHIPHYYGTRPIRDVIWIQCSLGCMSSMIQGRRVWVMRRIYHQNWDGARYISNASVRTKIIDLARIWGPIWKVTDSQDTALGIWYYLPNGYIGQPKGTMVSTKRDGIPCHFSLTAQSFGRQSDKHRPARDTDFLLIGQDLPGTFRERMSCTVEWEKALHGLALQLVGTSPSFRYQESMTVQVGVNHFGAQANWSTSFKTNPGILARQAFLQRWRLEPKFRNPRILLLLYGIQISGCTRNARRCRIIDLLRSEAIIQYLEAVYKPPPESDSHTSAMLASLKNPDPLSFLALYDANPSWRGELGSVVAHCIELLSTTGVNKNGDLAAFVFLGDLNNAEQLVIMPSKIHTWVGLLRDTFEMATFAVMSTTCLEFSRRPGQRCRCKGHKYDLKSMLETSYVPDQHTQVRRLFASMHINDRLKMQHSGKFKIKKRSSNGVLLGTWDIMRYALQPTYSREKYRERREEAEQAIRVFVLSKRRQALPRSKREKKSKSGLHSQHAGHDSTAVPTRESQSLPRSSQENPQSSNDLLIPSGAPMIEVDPLQNTSTASFLASVDESVTLSQTSKYMHSSTLMGSKDRLTPSLETPYGDRASFRTGSPFRVDKGIQTEPGQIPQASSKQSMSNGASHEGSEPIRLSSRVKGKERQHEIEVPPKIHQQPDDEDLLSPKTSETRHGQGRSGSRHNRSNKEDDTSPRSARHREKSDAETNGTDRSKHRRSRTSVEEINSSTRQNDVKRKLGLRYYD